MLWLFFSGLRVIIVMTNLFEAPMGAGLGNIQPPSNVMQPPAANATPQNPFPGSGITISQAPPDPAFEAQMDREEKAGAGNLQSVWQEHDRLKALADQAMQRYQQGQMSIADAAAVVDRYQQFRDNNQKMLVQQPVQRGSVIWNWLFGGGR